MTDKDRQDMPAAADMRSHLNRLIEKRRQIEKRLAANPDNRPELETLVVRMLDHEETQRDLLRELEFYDRICPLLNEAGEALGTGNQTTIDDAMEWHAGRGSEFAKAYLNHVNSPEYKQQSDELEAAFIWHPAWTKNDDQSWSCKTPGNPEVWETNKLLAQYRRHLAGHGRESIA